MSTRWVRTGTVYAVFKIIPARGSGFLKILFRYPAPSIINTPSSLTAVSLVSRNINPNLQIQLDRSAKLPISEQIRISISRAIESGVLVPGTRLPSWQVLAAHLGVARGTVQAAYERLSDCQMIETYGARGTLVAPRPRVATPPASRPGAEICVRRRQEGNAGPAIFQLGIPGLEDQPEKLFARARTSNLLKIGPYSSLVYPDPGGEFELRREIAGYLSISRNIHCLPEQVFITSGYSSGLDLSLRVLDLGGNKVWMEEPGFFRTRKALELARLSIVPVPVDVGGMNVSYAIENAGDAALAVVTPGQQAPLGSTLCLRRRLQLLDWASANGAWVIEDDYLSELQLEGRAAPALASLNEGSRVVHLGTFSKTIGPGLRLGFIVAPTELVTAFSEAAAAFAPAPSPVIQLAVAQFMHEGHYSRRVRRLKRLYSAQRKALCEQMRLHDAEWVTAGLAVLLSLPKGAPDVQIARESKSFGMAPSPLSKWFATPSWTQSGLLLGVATAPEPYLASSCDRLFDIIDRYC